MPKAKKWNISRPKSYTTKELATIAGVDIERVKLDVKAGALKLNTQGRVNSDQAVGYLERRRAGAPMARPQEAPATAPQAAPPPAPQNAEGLEKLFGGDIMALLDGLNVGDDILKNAAVIERISKTLLAVTQQNERAMKIQAEAGRHVDTKDIEVFLDRVFTDWIAEIRAMPSALEYKLAAKFEMEIERMREVLQEAANFLIVVGEDVAEKHSERMAEFMRQMADRARRRVDGGKRGQAPG